MLSHYQITIKTLSHQRYKYLASLLDYMVRGIGKTDDKKSKKGLMDDKDYITEAWLQGGKAIGEIVKPKDKKKKQ